MSDLLRAARRQVIISSVLCIVGMSCAAGSAIFNRRMAFNARTLVDANKSLRQTNDELGEANGQLQSALFEMQDANARLMSRMNELLASDRRLQLAGKELFKWDQDLKVRLAECLQ
jgi:uncharacterized protein (DUF3084 family)